MAILAYDDVWLREPRLLVPGMQPTGMCTIDSNVWPGRSQAFNPRFGFMGTIGIGSGTAITSANNNEPFTLKNAYGCIARYRPNSSPSVGETFMWNTPNIDIGSNGSMLFYGAMFDGAIGILAMTYGGNNWGLGLSRPTTTSVRARYVDSPTTAAYSADLTVSTIADKQVFALGLTKVGSTINVFCQGKKGTAAGGNGGIRKDPGYGLGYGANADGTAFTDMLLGAVTSAVLSDAQMHAILADPFSILIPA